LQTSSIRKLCEVPGAVLTAPTSPSGAHRPTLHDEEPVYRNNVEIACTNVVSTNLSGGAALGASVLVQAATLGEYLNYRDKVLRKQGTGSPEGVVTAGVGSVFHRRDGSGGTTLYVKESGSGNTGWVAYGSGASLPQLRLRSGLYYPVPQGPVTTTSPALNNLRVAPLLVPFTVTLNSIAIEVTTAGAAGAVLRLGILSDDGTGYPGALLLDAGTVDATTTGVKSIAISQALTPGVYWIGVVPQGAISTVRAVASPMLGVGAETASLASGNACSGYQQNSVSGALGAFTSTVALVGTVPASWWEWPDRTAPAVVDSPRSIVLRGARCDESTSTGCTPSSTGAGGPAACAACAPP
jgi:hypothetical protein